LKATEKLKNQVAVITGASSGIGKAIAIALAEQHTTLCLVGRRADALDSVSETVGQLGATNQTYCLDLTVDEKVSEFAELVKRSYGQVDILIHSAGCISFGDIASAPVTELDLQFRANVHAPYLLTQALLPMLRIRGGQIVFINSSIGLTTRPGVGQYSSTQHALKALTDTLRDEVNPQGIRVLSVYPGRTATPRQATIFQLEGRPYRPERLMQPEDIASVVVNALALSTTAEVTDIKIRPFVNFD
jgi:NADP-dependent 3-hydroxy acid dehydrogenase YdfG